MKVLYIGLLSLLEKWACRHVWKVLSQEQVTVPVGSSRGVIRKDVHYTCEKCGKIHKIITSV